MTRSGPLPGLLTPLAPLARLAEKAYLAELRRRNSRFDAGKGVVTIDRPVISVGNLCVGGTGKTPMVGLIIGWLLEAGHRPAVAMRGYGARRGVADEACEYKYRFGDDVAIVAQPDRLEGLFRLFTTEVGRAVDTVVLDDGFQHRRIARQLDLVLVDASRDPFGDRCLPAGWLREPVEALNRASGVVLTHTELVSPKDVERISARLESITGSRPLAQAEHFWSGLMLGGQRLPVDWLRGKRAMAVCAIGNPSGFIRGVEDATGLPVERRMVLRDHDSYARGTTKRVLRAAEGFDVVVTTEKDWSKLCRVPSSRWPCDVVRPRLEMRLRSGSEALRGRVFEAVSSLSD